MRGGGILIQEYDLKDFLFKDSRPLNIGMSNLKFKKETQYQFQTMDSLIEMYADYKNCEKDYAN